MAKTRNTRSTKSKKSSPSVETVVSASVPSSSSASPASASLASASSPSLATTALADTAPSLETLGAPAPALETATPSPRGVAMPDRELIARRAYELFLRRGAVHSDPMRDWLDAERELGCRAA